VGRLRCFLLDMLASRHSCKTQRPVCCSLFTRVSAEAQKVALVQIACNEISASKGSFERYRHVHLRSEHSILKAVATAAMVNMRFGGSCLRERASNCSSLLCCYLLSAYKTIRMSTIKNSAFESFVAANDTTST